MISWRRQAPRKTFQTSIPKPHAVEMPDSAKVHDQAAANNRGSGDGEDRPKGAGHKRRAMDRMQRSQTRFRLAQPLEQTSGILQQLTKETLLGLLLALPR
jgi:hypothetical protein